MDLRRLSTRNRAESIQPPIRPTISQIQQTANPSSPRTPTRTYTSNFSSPAGSYRSSDEEDVIFDFGSRYLRAGVAGESAPRCTLNFGPEESRRVGDYRQWLPGYSDRPKKKARADSWGQDHELWQLDLRDRDLGLVEDKVHRAVREAYTRFFLLDAKSRKAAIVLPSVLPHALISVVLSMMFNHFQMPSITLLSAPTMAVVAAGLRSGLVVDIGWHETSVTAVYEYREDLVRRSTRAMKVLTLEMARRLQSAYAQTSPESEKKPSGDRLDGNTAFDVEFDHAEEVAVRLAWCESYEAALQNRDRPTELSSEFQTLQIREAKSEENEALISLPLLSSSKPTDSKLPFSFFCSPVETIFVATPTSNHELDDHEQTLPLLIYNSLLQLPPDVRATCMSRIIFTGGGSNIPGLKPRLLDELSTLIQARGWDPVLGKAADVYRRRQEINHSHRKIPKVSFSSIDEKESDETPQLGAAAEPQTIDAIDEKFLKQEAKVKQGALSGVVRGVESLGSWAGASLVGGLRIKGIVEIERDTFLQHGLAGAKKDVETSVVQNRQSFGPGMAIGSTDKMPWTLGVWA